MMRKQDLAQLLLRLALGVGFILPVLDRLGYLGAPGGGTAAWGSWPVFVKYTQTLVPFLPAGLTNFAAVLVTVAESVFGICLIVGYRVRLVSAGAAWLTAIFGLSMAVFLRIGAPFAYPVFVFTGAAWLLATIPGYRWSMDEFLGRKGK